MGFSTQQAEMYLVMEYVNGGSVEELLKNMKIELTMEDNLDILLDVTRGIKT